MDHKTLPIGLSGVKFSDSNPHVFEGYASVFGKVDSYGDMIMPGAYTETLKPENRNGRAIKMRWNHYGEVIGKWLDMREDAVGLWVKGELTPNHSVASDVAASLLHKAVDGLSIGYSIMENDVTFEGVVRQLNKINLVEISVVEEPADTFARINNVKSALADAKTLKDVETFLRDACKFSRTDATALVSHVKSLSHGDRADKIDTSEIEALIKRRSLFAQ